MASALKDIAASLGSQVEQRLFAEYGAVFATTATPPPTIIFSDAAQVDAFQASLSLSREVFGEHEIQLQSRALEALAAASSEMRERGGRISARAADAGGRSYEDTVGLWTRNVTRGLEHWAALGRISTQRAQSIRHLDPAAQVAVILDLEETEQIFFGTFFDRSVLYSVAAPGASQHLSMLAFDVAEYEEREVEQVLGRHGWFRTVSNDLPHFTYLGYEESALASLGLHRIEIAYGDREYWFWTPDLDRVGKRFG